MAVVGSISFVSSTDVFHPGSPSGRAIASSTWDGTVTIYDAATATQVSMIGGLTVSVKKYMC